jgi:hypothetical protein
VTCALVVPYDAAASCTLPLCRASSVVVIHAVHALDLLLLQSLMLLLVRFAMSQGAPASTPFRPLPCKHSHQVVAPAALEAADSSHHPRAHS